MPNVTYLPPLQFAAQVPDSDEQFVPDFHSENCESCKWADGEVGRSCFDGEEDVKYPNMIPMSEIPPSDPSC